MSGILLMTLTLACGAPSDEPAPMSERAVDPTEARLNDSDVPDVVYGHKDEMALTFDVFKPASQSNGAKVLYIESGGWRSRWRPTEESRSRFDGLLSKGFTVLEVRHGSAPRYNAHEAYGDVLRAVRFVRLHAETYGVDPDRLGVHGGNTGGHLIPNARARLRHGRPHRRG